LAEGYLYVSFATGAEHEVLKGLEATQVVAEIVPHNDTTWVVRVVASDLHTAMDKVGDVKGVTDVNVCLAPPRRR
jgi:hypothetical protein